MNKYLLPLQTELKKLLPKNTNFSLCDSQQSFVTFPTNHINLSDDFITIEIGRVVYDNIARNDDIISNIVELFDLCTRLSNNTGEAVTVLEVADHFRICLDNFEDEDQSTSKDFKTIPELITYIKNNL
jgi:hypothetical protein